MVKFFKKIVNFFQDIFKKIFKIIKYFFLSPYGFFKKLFFITGVIVWICFFFLGTYLYNLFNKPDIDKLNFNDLKTIAQKSVLKKLKKDKKYKWTKIEDVNRHLLYAIVTSEDATFFKHNGINYNAFINALGENIKRREYAFGASTISQQVTKNLFLRNEKSINRKIKEIVVTKKLEKRFKKNQILEIYLNIAEFGPNIYGINSASKYYFKKTPEKANGAEGAFLALLLPSPIKYHLSIFKNKYISKKHKRKLIRILKGMLYEEYISPKQYRKYIRYKYFK